MPHVCITGQVKTKLAGSQYNDRSRRDHYFRIALASIKNCTYWAELYTGCKDLRLILDDEGIESDTDDDESLQHAMDRRRARKAK
jgi:hypothetical protein